MKKVWFVFVPVFLSFVLIFTVMTPVITESEDISTKVFRLHILANSNSTEDQALKLKVRDRILQFSEALYSGCSDIESAVSVTEKHLDSIEKIAQNTVMLNGYAYTVKAYVSKNFFDVRRYDGFTLPSGIYRCLKIEIGQAKGKNWWCVMYPAVCLSGCTDDFDEALTESEKQLILEDKYIIRFKLAEIYERIKNKVITGT